MFIYFISYLMADTGFHTWLKNKIGLYTLSATW